MHIVFWVVYVLFLLIEGFIAYHFIRTNNKIYFKSVLTANSIFALYLIAETVFKIGVPYLIRILVIAALFIHTFFGYYKDRYKKSKRFDRFLHAFGTFAYALFLYEILSGLLQPSVSPTIYEAIFVLVLGIATGTIFEIIEFMIDKKMPVQTQHGLQDTDVDMICNIIGSLVAAVVVYFF